MRVLLTRRVPVAWLLLVLIASAAIGILWVLISSGPPANSVLIHSAPNATLPQSPIAVGASGQPTQANGSMIAASPQSTQTPLSPQTIAIYISGAVKQPGVYTLPPDARVSDAVAAAGGPNPDADLERINLASRLSDEQHISVPRKGEAAALTQTQAPPTPPARSPTTQRTTQTAAGVPDGKINLNTADSAALESLPGIGDALAARIIADRDKNGPFKSVDDLKRVPGIGDAILSRIRDLIYVEP